MTSLTPVRTIAPATDPVLLAEAKAHLRVTHDLENDLIAALIDAAVSNIDGWSGILGRCIIAQTWAVDADSFVPLTTFPPPTYADIASMRLPFPDVQSVVVTYYDTANAQQTFAGSNYYLANRPDGTFLVLASTASWPSVYSRPDAVRVTMVCGLATVPVAIKQAILLMVGHWYANREASVIGVTVADLPLAVDALLAPYRQVGL